MPCRRPAIVGRDPRVEVGNAQQPIRVRHGPLALDPCRFNGVAPWTWARQWADATAHACGTPLDLLMMWADPGPHRRAAGLRGLVPDPSQGGAAGCRETGGPPRQVTELDGPHG